MNPEHSPRDQSTLSSETADPSLFHRVCQYMQDPLGSIVTATAATLGSFGFVLSGIWLVNLAVN